MEYRRQRQMCIRDRVFWNALVDSTEREINEIVDKFYNLYIDEVSNDPEGHAMDYVHVIMDIEKAY